MNLKISANFEACVERGSHSNSYVNKTKICPAMFFQRVSSKAHPSVNVQVILLQCSLHHIHTKE